MAVPQVTQLVQEGFGSDSKYPEGLRVELLKLGALLIEFMHKELMDHRKELIKFAWNNIKVCALRWMGVRARISGVESLGFTIVYFSV